MNNFDDYKKFFELRDKYPNLANLISELLAAYFRNKDSFPSQFYIYGSYSDANICTVLNELGITTKIRTNPIHLRDCARTIISIVD